MISSAIEGSPADHSRELVVIYMPEQGKYHWLMDVYPPIINKEQLYKICHVSKRTALAYLEYGMIPCGSTGKKTHKYRIKLVDVIRFLEARDLAPGGFIIPPGWYKEKKQDEVIILTQEILLRLRTALEAMLETYPDVLTPQHVREITGYALSAIVRKRYRQRHKLACLVAGVAEHHALVARAGKRLRAVLARLKRPWLYRGIASVRL